VPGGHGVPPWSVVLPKFQCRACESHPEPSFRFNRAVRTNRVAAPERRLGRVLTIGYPGTPEVMTVRSRKDYGMNTTP